MTNPQHDADREELRQLKREIRKLKRKYKKANQAQPAVEAARITAEATQAAAEKSKKSSLLTGVIAALIAGSGAVGAAVINSNVKSDPVTETSTTQMIDCTDQLQQALGIYRLHPEITIPYANNDPVQQLCLLNERIDEVRKADNL